MDNSEHDPTAASARVQGRTNSGGIGRFTGRGRPAGKPDSKPWVMLKRGLLLVGLAALPAACSHSTSPGPAAVRFTPAVASPAPSPSPMGAQTAASWTDFHRTVEPILALYCYPCHGADKSEKGLRLDLFADEQSLHLRFDALNKALAMLYTAKMPPPCEYQPSPQEVDSVTGWIIARQKLEIAAQFGR